MVCEIQENNLIDTQVGPVLILVLMEYRLREEVKELKAEPLMQS